MLLPETGSHCSKKSRMRLRYNTLAQKEIIQNNQFHFPLPPYCDSEVNLAPSVFNKGK
jgi:hypothetical protein